MKKILLSFVVVSLFLFSFTAGCKKTSPLTAPATATEIPPTATVTATIAPTFPYSDLAAVPGGTYTQTDETGTNSFSHTVSAFKIGKYEVTYDLWYTVYQWAVLNGYTFINAGTEGNAGIAGAAPTSSKYQPVSTISWRDVIVWCNAYSEKSGLMPVYYSDAGLTAVIKISTSGAAVDIAAGSVDNPYVNWNANGYRLPTEGEWQYAASYKDGSSWTPYNYASGATADYNDATATNLVAWYNANSGSVIHDIGGKTANALDIYDMSGNIYEWCWDWDAAYPGASVNYTGPATGSYKIVRGGFYNFGATFLQVSRRNRNYGGPSATGYYIGFRIVRTY